MSSSSGARPLRREIGTLIVGENVAHFLSRFAARFRIVKDGARLGKLLVRNRPANHI